MDQILTSFGFTENEQSVYVGIYKNPLSTGSDIARKLRMDKSSVYKAVQNLVDKGFLVSSEGRKGIVYTAASPETLKELYTSQKLKLEHDGGLLSEFVKKLQNPNEIQRNFYFVVERGVDNFKMRMNESLSCKENLIRERWDYHLAFADADYVRFADEYAHKRVDLRISLRVMNSNIGQVQKAFKDVLKDRKTKLKEVRIMPEEIKENSIFRIWDETVNILSFNENEDFIVVTIKDKYLAEMMKSFYDFIWDRSERATKTI